MAAPRADFCCRLYVALVLVSGRLHAALVLVLVLVLVVFVVFVVVVVRRACFVVLVKTALACERLHKLQAFL